MGIRPTRLEIDLDIFRGNLTAIKDYKNKDTKICAVIKANAYGCGSYEIARTALECGAEYLAVAILDEAIILREKGIKAPILILGDTPIDRLEEVIDFNLTQTIFNMETVIALDNLAYNKGAKNKIHIKIDTGMNRLGFQIDDGTVNNIKTILKFKNLEVEGIYSHLSKVYDGDREFSQNQIDRFMNLMDELSKENIRIPLRHILSSGGLIEHSEYQLDMVRLGCLMYGLYPPCSQEGIIKINPIFSFKTKIAHIKEVSTGSQISYSGLYTTDKKSIIGTLPIGYCDGYPRRLSCKGHVIVNGQLAPIRGNICMDMCMIDLTDIQGVSKEDDVILIGESKGQEITLQEVTNIVDSVRTEILGQIPMRVPRIYVNK